ncbi:hypothetical protein JW935_07885 [candidate division KSB1 bacterium]|nr:hypothetical protein [candidate division KSB1 bacterium]
MKIKTLFLLCLVILYCTKDKKPKVVRPKGSFNATTPDRSDHEANGGILRFTLSGKAMHDDFFIAQFTPRGDIFTYDNLQLANYHIGSDKYPKFLINVDYAESDLSAWEGKSFPMDFLAFVAAPNTSPLNSKGKVTITRVTPSFIEGRFSGQLVHPVNGKTFPIKGEFKGIIKLNV